MKEVARAAGVSQSTVSRVLNGSSEDRVPITADTKARIARAVQELGYRPNPLARGLRGGGTALLGLVVREIADPFFTCAIEVIATEAQRNGFNLVLGHARSSGDEALALAGVLETRHCDGIILLGDLRDIPDVWNDLSNASLPLVALCQGPRTPGIPTVNTNNRQGIELALDHLWSLGHRRIAFIDAGWFGDVGERREAYLDWIQRHHVRMPTGYQQTSDNDPASGMAALDRLIALREPPTAVVCATDLVALGALAAAAKAGVKVPEQISVVGFDDIPMAQFAVPSLTTVHQPLEEMAREAIGQVVSLIKREDRQPVLLRICEPQLVVRDSAGSPRRRVGLARG